MLFQGFRPLPAHLALCGVLCAGCAQGSKNRRSDDPGGDGSAPVLIDARRLPDAVVQRSRRGERRHDLRELRTAFCEGREDDPVIFYQLVVSRHWHYYWLCSESEARRAATREGAERLREWIREVRGRATDERDRCAPQSTERMFRTRHESGLRVSAYCDGALILIYPDGGRMKLSLGGSRQTAGGGASTGGTRTPPARHSSSGSPSGGGGGRVSSSGGGGRCPPCPRSSSGGRPKCPPPKLCPACKKCESCPAKNSKAACAEYGRGAFWQGVKKACRAICTNLYKRCRKLNPKTSMCYQLSEYCASIKGICKR